MRKRTYLKYLKSKVLAMITKEKNGTYAVRSQIFKCVLLNFFIILTIQQHMKTNEFHPLRKINILNY